MQFNWIVHISLSAIDYLQPALTIGTLSYWSVAVLLIFKDLNEKREIIYSLKANNGRKRDYAWKLSTSLHLFTSLEKKRVRKNNWHNKQMLARLLFFYAMRYTRRRRKTNETDTMRRKYKFLVSLSLSLSLCAYYYYFSKTIE